MTHVIIRDKCKTKNFNSYPTASLYLIFKWLITKNKAYRKIINDLLWYWKTGASKVEFKIGEQQ